LQYEVAMANTTDEATRTLFTQERQQRPKAFQPAIKPPMYSSPMDLDLFVDPPLHLIALGVVKATVRFIDVWTANIGRKSHFLKLVRPELRHIQGLDLDWCELMPKQFGGKYGGYISDNYMALCRLSPWLYSPLLILPLPEPYVEPTTPVEQWLSRDCRPFLLCRGLKVPRGTEEQKRQL
jgi:hypothetical protein